MILSNYSTADLRAELRSRRARGYRCSLPLACPPQDLVHGIYLAARAEVAKHNKGMGSRIHTDRDLFARNTLERRVLTEFNRRLTAAGIYVEGMSDA